MVSRQGLRRCRRCGLIQAAYGSTSEVRDTLETCNGRERITLMDESNNQGDLFGAGAAPGPKKSEQTMQAIFEANVALIDLGEKILARTPLTPEEGTLLLNASWTVYLFALAAGDIQEAKEAADFTTLVSKYLKLLGYLVRFEDNGYCVTARGHKGLEDQKGK